MIKEDWERVHLTDKIYLEEDQFLEENSYLSEDKKVKNERDTARIIIEGWSGHESLLPFDSDQQTNGFEKTIKGAESNSMANNLNKKGTDNDRL